MLAQAASAGATPASLASLDSLLESLLRVAGVHARMQALQWALSLRQNILTQVGQQGCQAAATPLPICQHDPHKASWLSRPSTGPAELPCNVMRRGWVSWVGLFASRQSLLGPACFTFCRKDSCSARRLMALISGPPAMRSSWCCCTSTMPFCCASRLP